MQQQQRIDQVLASRAEAAEAVKRLELNATAVREAVRELDKQAAVTAARGNAETERHVVGLADLNEQDVVLVLGPGPGIGLQAAGMRSTQVIGIDPSDVMLTSCRRRCAKLIEQGRVQLRRGVAEHTGQAADSVDVVLAVNNAQI